ncbi:MAG: cation transporter [Oligoflexia bacterium]|nr:cation transporter [Oligoflexia bacterium]
MNTEIDQKIRVRIGVISLITGIIIFILKWIAFFITSSTALKSDAIESVVNIVAAVFALGAIIFAGKPADKTHPYGHGKIEYFSAAFEGGMISIAAIFIMYEAIKAFIEQPQLKELNLGLAINTVAGLFNGLLGLYLINSGKKQKSKAIEADGHHVLSDFYTTLGILVALLVVKFTSLWWLDPLIAVVVSLLLAWTGFKLVKNSAAALLDEEDEGLIKKILAHVNTSRTNDIISIHALRTMRSGRFTHVDIHITVPEFYETGRAHDLTESFGQKIINDLKIEGEFHSHIDPCHRLYCEKCAVEPCPVRAKNFIKQQEITLAEALEAEPPGMH